jgi:hypothetical protein
MEFEREIIEELYNIITEDDDCEFRLDRMLEVFEVYFQHIDNEEPDFDE